MAVDPLKRQSVTLAAIVDDVRANAKWIASLTGLPACSRLSLRRATIPANVGHEHEVPVTPWVVWPLHTTVKPVACADTSGKPRLLALYL